MRLMHNEYKFNGNFRRCVDEYCEKNKCTLEDAFDSDQVKKKFYMYIEV